MPNIKSTAKRLRQDAVRRIRNRAAKSAMRTQIRKVREAVKAGDFELAENEYRTAAKKLDKAGSKNIIHKNTAARTKSRLHRLIVNAKNAA